MAGYRVNYTFITKMKPQSLTLGDFFLICHVSLISSLQFVQLYCIDNLKLMYKMMEVCKTVMRLCIIYTLSVSLEYTASSTDIMVFQSTREFRAENLSFRRLIHTVPILYLHVENISPNKYVNTKVFFCYVSHIILSNKATATGILITWTSPATI